MNKFFNRRFIISLVVSLGCLFFFAKMLKWNLFQFFSASFSFFLLIPFLYIKIILKEPLKNFGVALGDWKKGLLWMVIATLIYIPVIYLIDKYFVGFSIEYAPSMLAMQSFWNFIVHELLFNLFFIIAYEFFFSGFVMLGIFKNFNHWGILAKTGSFFGLFYLTGSIEWSFALYLLAVPLNGIVAYKSRSIIYSSLLNLFIILGTDIWIIKF